MSYLLDTHILVWLLSDTGPSAGQARAAIEEPEANVVVSVVTALEVATKFRLGKFPTAADLVHNWDSRLAQLGAGQLPISPDHGLRAGLLDWSHRDPFDRLLVAQASVDNLTLVTADPAVLAAPDVRLLRWN